MHLLYDSVLPQSLSHEAPTEVELERWAGGEVSDCELIRLAAEKECRAVILLGRDSLEQPEMRAIAKQQGIALVAVATDSPIEAKKRILKNLTAIRSGLANHDCLMVMAASVRPA